MILSTKGRYGLKIMYELALNYGEGPMPLKEIAQRQQLSETYLEQLIAHLKKAGLVRSIRGAQGGYELIRKPEEISVGEIIRTLEGPLAPSECVMDDEPECSKAENCVTRLIWEKIMEGINNVVDSITLNDMVNDYYKLKRKKEGEK
ncbi:MAG TPA: Rrf2 family transcriptional regulator [Bacillota bacterium]|nr:Rrf2 family transcriptional regulator [Bacillota bacterium]HPX70096.1 Rrf2 family transcriptional regulator [Bacillota bacterium]HQA66028.1 Rrf2 family transcriptional regulator [Bacillota bacterium]HQO42048.1 Rrf2 family transcriptional regulator [Bacillota bacterium]HQQ45609.1 Rrf2 family transcriptional regulator [Bacillota bacterium]